MFRLLKSEIGPLMYHNIGRRYIGMARMPASRNIFSKPHYSNCLNGHVHALYENLTICPSSSSSSSGITRHSQKRPP